MKSFCFQGVEGGSQDYENWEDMVPTMGIRNQFLV